ncbi:MAG: DUF928 domain-containing protein [Cyanobacteria bacterium J06639_14]
MGILQAQNAENPNPFSDLGRPPNRTHGGDRSSNGDLCLEELVIALVPGSPVANCQATDNSRATDSESDLAQTVTESPAVWIFIPDNETFRSAPSAELVLLDDETGNLLWQGLIESFHMLQNQGIIRIPIDHTLEPGRIYRWSFTITVDPDIFEQNPTVEGLIEYVPPTDDLVEKIDSLPSQPEQIDVIYTQYGIWHDALTLVGEQLSQDSENVVLQTTWSDLLTSIGLGELANVPIIDCCNPNL